MGRNVDLVVIGSGGAAFAAAIRGRDLDARVVMVERGVVGGTCVNVGCIPSKTLIRAAETLHDAAEHPFDGIVTSASAPDLVQAVAQKDRLVEKLRKSKYQDLLHLHGIELIQAEARFISDQRLDVAGETLGFDHAVIATGARPDMPKVPGLLEASPLTSTSALELQAVPEHLVVIGGGYIALEMGELYANLGARVTLVARSGIMRHEEPEVAQVMERVLADRGVRVLRGATVESVEGTSGDLTVVVNVDDVQERIAASHILVASGRSPNIESLDLAAAGIKADAAGIEVDDALRTSNPRVFAAGDVVAGAPKFVYVAARMGRVAAANAVLNEGDSIDYRSMPRVTFTSPQIAAVGMTDAQVLERGVACMCTTLPLSAVPRAIVDHDEDGFIKLVADRQTRRLLGATIVAKGAGDVIQAAVYALEFGLTVDQLAATWAPYLTMSEGLKLAAQTFDRDVTELSCCAG